MLLPSSGDVHRDPCFYANSGEGDVGGGRLDFMSLFLEPSLAPQLPLNALRALFLSQEGRGQDEGVGPRWFCCNHAPFSEQP